MTAISKTAAFRGVSDCKIAKLTADTSAALTYGSLLDVPIQNLSITENRENHELKHDDSVQAVESVLQTADISGTMARVPLDVLNALEGGTITATGTTKQTYVSKTDDTVSYFKLEIVSAKAHADAGDVADVHIQFKKCKVQTLDYSIEDGFATINFTAKAIKTIKDGEIKSVVFNKTATEIA